MSWFKRKDKNRRLRRTHVLDVKLSATQRRQTRWRRTGLLLTVLVSVFAGLLLVWRGGEWAMRQLIYDNPGFAIRRLEVETDGVLSLEQLRHWAGVKLNDNLWELDLARVKRDLELMPIIQSVSIERILPHTLRIRVSEREPIAQYTLPQARFAGVEDRGVYLLDEQGYVMFPLESQQRATPAPTNEHLPALVGVPATDLSPGHQVESPQVRAALLWIVAFARSAMAGLIDLKQIDVSQRNVLLVTTGQGAEITFGLLNPDLQLRRWRAIADFGQKNGKCLVAADLSVSNNIPTRWTEASLVPPSTPRPLPTLRNRKKCLTLPP